MTANINEDELKLLTFLHEHAAGYGASCQLLSESIVAAMNLDKNQFRKCASYLEEHGLIGIKKVDFKSQVPTHYEFTAVWLTGPGEDYIRQLEAAPGIARKLTVSVVGELWQMGKGAIVSTAGQMLAEFAKHFHR